MYFLRSVIKLCLVALVVALMLLAAGCGGSGRGDGPLTRAEFISQGDAICARTEAKKDAELGAIFTERAEAKEQIGRADEEELVTTVALPWLQRMSDELASLDAPEGKQAAGVVSAFEVAIAEIEAEPSSVLSGGSEPLARADSLAADYGFKVCGLL